MLHSTYWQHFCVLGPNHTEPWRSCYHVLVLFPERSRYSYYMEGMDYSVPDYTIHNWLRQATHSHTFNHIANFQQASFTLLHGIISLAHSRHHFHTSELVLGILGLQLLATLSSARTWYSLSPSTLQHTRNNRAERRQQLARRRLHNKQRKRWLRAKCQPSRRQPKRPRKLSRLSMKLDTRSTSMVWSDVLTV